MDNVSESPELIAAREAYAQRQADRADRMNNRADRLEAEAASRLGAARQTADMIPFGQPMMPGHHSYRADVNRRERMRANFSKGYEAQKEAAAVRDRAGRVGTAGIASDDPDAVVKLREKLAKLERKQEAFKAVNAAIRKHAKAGEAAQLEALTALGYKEETARKLLTPDFAGRVGIPSYELTNNNAEIRRTKKRIEELSSHDVTADVDHGGEGWAICLDDGRLVLSFDVRQSAEVRAMFAGWKWAPSRKAFVRKDTPAARADAVRLAGALPGVVIV